VKDAIRDHLRQRATLLAVIAGLLVAVVAVRWSAFASAGDAERSLAVALADEVEVDTEGVVWFEEGDALTYRSAIFRGHQGGPGDLFHVQARVGGDGEILGVRNLSNLTRTSSADELAPVRVGESHVVYASRVSDRFDAITVLDLRGEPQSLTSGWPARAKAQNAVTNLQETGRAAGFGRRRYSLLERSERLETLVDGDRVVAMLDGDARVTLAMDRDEPVTGGEHVELRPMEKGQPGTITWVVDTVRNLSWVGPEPIAWLEHRVFGFKDWAQRTYYSIAGAPDTEAEVAEELGVTEEETRRRAELSVTDPEIGWPPRPIVPTVAEPARGEGEWLAIADDPFVRSYPNAPPALLQTFLQVDPQRPFTRVHIAIFDPRLTQLRIMTGTQEPESATGETGRGMVPRDEETLSRVVAGFNGGFQALHGEFGMMSEGRVYLPPKPWAATVAVRDDGQVAMGSWLDPPEGRRRYSERWATAQIPEDMVEFRQNLTSVVEGDRWNPWRRWYWGAAPQGDDEQVYIDRSGLCLTEEGFLAYFWGKSMGAEELGRAMLATRCVRGLHLDMNQRHTAFELYHAYREDDPPPEAEPIRGLTFETRVDRAPGWRVRGRKLARSMTPMRFPRYIRRDARDFFYVTLKPVLPGPHLEGSAEGEGVFSTSGLPHAGFPHAFARAWLGTPEARTWLVRIDPTRAMAPGVAHEQATRPLAYVTNGRALRGSQAVYATRELIGWRYAVGAPPEDARVILEGEPMTATATAAMGVDRDGFLVYAESAGDPVSLAARLEAAGVSAAIALPEDARLAFDVEGTFAGPDEYVREVAVEAALPLLANERPASEVLFPDVQPRPYMYWGPMQDSRVRYFRPEGPSRFQGPNSTPN